jgi:TPP-dependent pyruvate/acetoin dehydrogenase alpha subunit
MMARVDVNTRIHSLPLPSAQTRIGLHQAMLRIRRVEEAIAKRYAEGEMRCPTHFCIGQEAIPVGLSAHLRPTDAAFSGHRSHGHYLAKGGSLRAMIAELYGRSTGCAAGRGGSQHLIDLEAGFIASAPILAGTIPIAVGAALGAKRRGLDHVAVVYFGDGAFEEGSTLEALNYAAVYGLAVVFVCENNLYSVHSALGMRQPRGRRIAEVAEVYRIAGETIEGNDVAQVWSTARDAVDRARSGGGPTLIEAMTYRWLEHCGPNSDYDLPYRPREEIEAWISACPVRRSEQRLREEGLYSAEQGEADENAIAAEIADAFAFARNSPFPDPSTLNQFTYPEHA